MTGGSAPRRGDLVRVLVVDDDFMVARVHAGFVARTPGFEVVGVAHTGAQALVAASELEPDLVLLDVYLPDTTGLEVLRALRERSPRTDVLVVSAARDVATVQEAVRGGVVHYLVKPFDSAALSARLHQYAERSAALSGLRSARQEDVDRLFAAAGPELQRGAAQRGTTMPKGLTEQTADLVRAALQGAVDGLSATECAEATGLSRVGARRYLEHFTGAGRAEVRLRYGGTGRPERRYCWRV